MEKILTVTIPSYNVEKYLKQTLDSFLAEEILEGRIKAGDKVSIGLAKGKIRFQRNL